MNPQSAGLRVSSVVFGLVCLVHVLRLILGFQIVIGGHVFGNNLSLIAIIFTGLMSIWLWKLSGPGCVQTKTGAPPPKV